MSHRDCNPALWRSSRTKPLVPMEYYACYQENFTHVQTVDMHADTLLLHVDAQPL